MCHKRFSSVLHDEKCEILFSSLLLTRTQLWKCCWDKMVVVSCVRKEIFATSLRNFGAVHGGVADHFY